MSSALPAFDGVIFDLDGTLADTLHDIARAMNHALETHGLPIHAIEAYRHFLGSGLGVLVEHALPAGARSRKDELVAAFRARYIDHLLVETKPYPGIVELLAALQLRGAALAVLSNKPQLPTERIVAALFPDTHFAAVYGQRAEVPRKPDPSAAVEIAAAMSLPCDRVAFVGDTDIDVETALRAGMLPVAVSWGFRSREELLEAGAGHFIEQPKELMTLP